MAYTDLERRIVLIACSISAFITPLLSTMMNLSLVSIGEKFAVGSHDLAYVNTAFLLSSVIFMVPLAKVGDIYGKRRTYIAGLLVILVACILAILSPNFWFLIMCR
ncbi:MAG: MFS transporter, partial [Candidatus Methanomethylophilaceae archaeon]|nr:MFS transporter [Candidatus Methanomethylophilaceae archaeon]